MASLLQPLLSMRAQPLRFALVGGLTALTYIALTLLLNGRAGFPIQLAMPVAYALALAVHFSGQRYFVFRSPDGFALSVHEQAGRYVAIGLVQLAISALATTFLPDVLHVDERVVYVVVTVVLTIASFLLLRLHVFHDRRRTASSS